MKYWEMILFLLSVIIDVSTNAQEVTCEGEQLINVDILIGHPGIVSPYKPGHILVFRCTDVNQKMHGHRAIECQSDGKWDHPYPTCRGIRCEVPRDQHLSFPDIYFREDMKLGAKHNYYCESGYEKKAEEATCTRDGWTPNPLCAEITCELQSTTSGVKKIIPEGKTMFRAGESVEIICSVRRLWFFKETSKKFTCQDNGEWDHKPGCEGIRCEVPRDQHVSHPDNYFRGDMKLGTKHNYYCESGYEKKAEEATCTQDGWTPNPLCTGIRCEVPRDQHVSHPDNYFIGDMKLGAKHNYYCESGYEKNAEEATCTQDGWTPNPLCTVMTASSKCGTPPTVNNADTVEMTKKEYNTGERVEFICFNKYTLDSHSPFSKYLTCQQGEWTGKVKCLKPCAVTVEEMDERGIEPAFTDQQKLFAPHDDHITFKCQWGKNSVGFTPRHKCNDGVMTLPKCV